MQPLSLAQKIAMTPATQCKSKPSYSFKTRLPIKPSKPNFDQPVKELTVLEAPFQLTQTLLPARVDLMLSILEKLLVKLDE